MTTETVRTARSAGSTPLAPGGFERLMSVDEALERLLLVVTAPLPGEPVTPLGALGRVVAEAVLAATSLPPWDNSAMDGYAVRAADTVAARDDEPVELRVIGEVRAGFAGTQSVQTGMALRIATGAPVPPGADAVVPVEATTPIDDDGRRGPRGREAAGRLPAACLVHEPVPIGGSIRPAASDLIRGQTIIAAGTVVTPLAVALLAGAGIEQLLVHRRPRIAVLATGDEVRAPGEPLGPAGIPDANRPGLLAQVAATGGEPIDLGVATDRLDDVLSRLRAGLELGADAIVVSGGVSVGPFDVVRTAFAELGRIDLWRVALQPGKPFAFGTVIGKRTAGHGESATLLFGLPGNPVSSMVTFEVFVRPALRRLAGHSMLHRPLDRAVLLHAATKSRGRRAFLRVGVERDASGQPVRDADGNLQARLAGGQGSHVLSALASTEALAIVPEAMDAAPTGTVVDLMWLDPIA